MSAAGREFAHDAGESLDERVVRAVHPGEGDPQGLDVGKRAQESSGRA
ncbi:hypothetical protein [Actinacidiphila oryziradicis]|nr:hypothetical protein [Actinacidiphila oryziradicis]